MPQHQYQQHPLSAAFPAMSDRDFGELRADIAQHGLRFPIVLFEDMILDGWHRERACRDTGTAPHYVQFEGDAKAAARFVVSANLLRRHLNESQRGMIAGKLAQLPAHRPDKQANLPASETVSDAAALLNVSERTVKDARTVLASGDAAAIAAVERGDVAVSSAAKEVRAARPRLVRPSSQPEADAIAIAPQTIEQWKAMPAELRAAYCAYRNPKATLNRQNAGEDDNAIDWAKWSWNTVTGCLHGCPYCYARDEAERWAGPAGGFPNGFAPTFRADRLAAPLNTRPRNNDDPREGRIFVGSMTDLFGRWVPTEWIDATLDVMRLAPQWEFLMLTKYPQHMADFDIPANAWVGTTVDLQVRVKGAEKAFEKIKARSPDSIRWLSCEPLLEPLQFERLDLFDLLVIGGASRSSKTPEWIPPFSWLDDLHRQAEEAGCAVFMKSNLYRKESPRGARYKLLDHAPESFDYLRRASSTDEKAE